MQERRRVLTEGCITTYILVDKMIGLFFIGNKNEHVVIKIP